MTSPTLDALREEYRRLQTVLAGPLSQADQPEIKARLLALLQGTDAAISDLTQFREELRALGQRYKEATARQGAVPRPPGAHQVTRHDRLGASTYVEKGWHLISAGDHVGAVQALTQALDLAPDDAQAGALLGWAQMLQEEYDAAMVTFAGVLERDPGNTLARVNVGYICLKKRIFGEAIEHLSRVIRDSSDRKATLYAHYYLGLVYLERGMLADAGTFLERAVALGPNLVEARCELGRALWFAGRESEAKAAWRIGAEQDVRSGAGAHCRRLLELAEAGGEVPRVSSS
jgi:tetratricopeptide (TPR) repeat protein